MPTVEKRVVGEDPKVEQPEAQVTPLRAVADDKPEWPIKVKLLHKAIRDNKNEEIKEITFREPTGGDISRHGNPVKITQEGDAEIIERKMTMMMSALSGVLPPFIEAMDTRDWNSCAYRLRGFFLPEMEAW